MLCSYALSSWEAFQACLWREVIIMKRNSFVYIFRILQVSHEIGRMRL